MERAVTNRASVVVSETWSRITISSRAKRSHHLMHNRSFSGALWLQISGTNLANECRGLWWVSMTITGDILGQTSTEKGGCIADHRKSHKPSCTWVREATLKKKKKKQRYLCHWLFPSNFHEENITVVCMVPWFARKIGATKEKYSRGRGTKKKRMTWNDASGLLTNPGCFYQKYFPYFVCFTWEKASDKR